MHKIPYHEEVESHKEPHHTAAVCHQVADGVRLLLRLSGDAWAVKQNIQEGRVRKLQFRITYHLNFQMKKYHKFIIVIVSQGHLIFKDFRRFKTILKILGDLWFLANFF